MPKYILFILVLINHAVWSQSDSISLNELIVNGYNFNSPWISTPTNAILTDSTQLNITHGLSSSEALNTNPSVRFDERGIDGSRRISIRGSGLRSPFGVRNIKFYWNNIPFSSPDGSTGLEVLDTRLVDQLEVIKGPTASAYGSGMGGVILGTTNITKNELSAGVTLGSWGTLKQTVSFSYLTKKWRIKGASINGLTAGYREQEANHKSQQLVLGEYQINENNRLNILVNNYIGSWQLPGAIDSLQVIQNPRQSVPFSIDNNTRVDRNRFRVGLTHTFNKEGFKLTSSLYGNRSTKINPFGTSPFFNGYKEEDNLGAGGRVVAKYKTYIKQLPTTFVFGTEIQLDKNELEESDLLTGKKDQLRFTEKTLANAGSLFTDVRFAPNNWIITLGGSINGLIYNSKNQPNNSVSQAPSIHNLELVFTPKISALYRVSDYFSTYASYSKGFNQPTIWDLREGDSTLAPEVGNNIEFGLKYGNYNHLRGSMVLFNLNTQNAIVSTQQPDLSFKLTNAGFTQQQGIETSISIDTLSYKKWQVSFTGVHTYSRYIFKDYNNNGTDFSGKLFPGVPQHRASIITRVNSPLSLYLNVIYTHEGSVFLNDLNSKTQNAYGLLSLKLGWKHSWGKFGLNLSFLGTNLTNSTYSSFLQLNGFGGRFYNPSAARSFFGNASVCYSF